MPTKIPNLKEYYQRSFSKKDWTSGDLKKCLEFINQKNKFNEISSILEIGCGMAELPAFLPSNFSYYGLDPAEECVKKSKELWPRHNFVRGIAESLPFKNESFDLVFSVQVIEHVSDPKAALKEMFRVLKTGGFLIIIAPNMETPWSTINAIRHFNYYQRLVLGIKRSCDVILRFVGFFSFRTIDKNFTETTGRYERSDDDLKYITSGYEISSFFKKMGLEEIYFKELRSRNLIKKIMTRLPVFKYSARGIFLIFKK